MWSGHCDQVPDAIQSEDPDPTLEMDNLLITIVLYLNYAKATCESKLVFSKSLSCITYLISALIMFCALQCACDAHGSKILKFPSLTLL